MTLIAKETLDKLPYVHFFLKEAIGGINGHIVRVGGNSIVCTNYTLPSMFQLIPLTENGDVIEPIQAIQTRSEFLKKLGGNWRNVAIRCRKGTFVSFGRAGYIPWSASKKIGEFEIFSVEYHPTTDCFSFKTHNSLYLHLNQTFRTVECRPAPPEAEGTVASNRSWCISPLLSTSPEEERVEFVGVSNSYGDFEMSLRAEGGNISDHLNNFLYNLIDSMPGKLQPGKCTHFCGGCDNNFWHYFLRDEENGALYVVITTHEFSRALAGECVNALKTVYKKYSAAYSEPEDVRKELEFLTWEFNEQNEARVAEPALKKMESNIAMLIEKTASKKKILQAANDLNEQRNLFKQRATRLRDARMKQWKYYSAVIRRTCIGITIGHFSGLVGVKVGHSLGLGHEDFFNWLAKKMGNEVTNYVASEVDERLGGAAPGAGMFCMWWKYVPITRVEIMAHVGSGERIRGAGASNVPITQDKMALLGFGVLLLFLTLAIPCIACLVLQKE